MNVIALYDQVTTTWEKLRANILSHFIVVILLWLVGFSLPFPDVGIADLNKIVEHPIYEHVQGVGLLAVVSLCVALGSFAYALLLREIGQIVLLVVLILFPPDMQIARIRQRMPSKSLFVIASTLEPGEYQPNDLGSRQEELLAEFVLDKPEEIKSFVSKNNEMQKDATTHLQNASVFLFAWVLAATVIPDDNQLKQSIDIVFWPALGVLLAYVLLSYRSFVVSLQNMFFQLTKITVQLIASDREYSERLRKARKSPAPYFALVKAYQRKEFDDVNSKKPSLKSWIIERFELGKWLKGWRKKSDKPFDAGNWEKEQETFVSRGRRFGWDESVNQNYKDPFWIIHYARWQSKKLYYRVKGLGAALLAMVGLYQLKK